MSNPTTPFSWQMPTATDLVTDLPADFEVFGQAVATSMADLLGGTTAQVLSKTTNADMDFTWVAANPGDITGVTAGVGITGGGTSGTVTVTNDMATTITAAGDIVIGTGSGIYDNLPIGTTAQVLTADTTVSPYKVKWATPAAGAMTLISTTTFSGATTANIDGIFSSTYSKYQIILTGWSASASLNLHMKFRYGSTTESSANYYQTSKGINVNDTTSTLTEAGGTHMRIGTETQGPGGILNLTFVDVGTSAIQPYFSGIWSGQSTTTQLVGGTRNGTQQIYTGLQFLSSSGNVAGKITVYGLAS